MAKDFDYRRGRRADLLATLLLAALAAAVAASAFLSSCAPIDESAGGGPGAPVIDASGVWVGNYVDASGLATGPFRLDVAQSGVNVDGRVELPGSGCFDSLAYSGIVSGSTLFGGADDGFGNAIDLVVDLSEDALAGTYDVLSTTGCGLLAGGTVWATR